MDRLERALQKAREQRQENRAARDQAEADTARGKNAAAPIPSLGDGAPIVYQRTQAIAPSDEVLESHRMVARQGRTQHADIFRILRTKVLQQMTKEDLTTLAITSPNPGEGKTTVAINLALSLSMDLKQTVLLVDLDLRDPSVHTYLSFEPRLGLGDYLFEGTPIPDCLVYPGFERLVVLPVNRKIDNSSEMLASPRMAALAHELKSRYPDRIVIYDMPPLLTQDDSIAFLPHVDATLLVVKEGSTRVEDVRQAVGMLSGRNLIGTVLNHSTEQSYN